MRIVFFGTPDFAIPSLEILNNSQHEIVGVVTAPDKQRGRGRSLSVTPIKQFALDNDLKVLTPEKLKDKNLERELIALEPELFVVVAFRILPENIYTIPKKGSFNLHGSLLPKYRGAAPIQWAIINGESETGLTTFFLEKKVDTGNVILRERIAISPEDNLGTLHDRMSSKGADLVLKTVELIQTENILLEPQDNSKASPAPKINKDICQIDWKNSAIDIHNLIRGLSPFPGAFFYHDKKLYKVFKSEITELTELQPFEIRESKSEILIGTSTTALRLLELQPEGRKRMKAEDFLRGYQLNNE